MFFDPTYLIMVGPALLLAVWAQYKVKSTFRRYSQQAAANGLTGGELAGRLLASSGKGDVRVEVTQGALSDHYDPRSKTLRLSPDVYSGRSVAAQGVAAHEAGHAMQDAAGYLPMRIRAGLVPVASLGSQLAFPLILIGFFMRASGLIQLGIIVFAAAVLFQIVTLPVEFNASRRALASLAGGGYLAVEEQAGARKVLTAAALTYVAAALAAVMQLIYFMTLGDRRR
ncbi:MAG: zinc metallopeptidase [Actinobacteria bacterium]|nr:MAG: zinc metallopeptidase [Actinomycetota bacterium]